jgi:hypothetical protein
MTAEELKRREAMIETAAGHWRDGASAHAFQLVLDILRHDSAHFATPKETELVVHDPEPFDELLRLPSKRTNKRPGEIAEEIMAQAEALQPQEPTPATRILNEGIEEAWGVIANAGNGDWRHETQSWRTAAARWRDMWVGKAAAKTQPPTPPR